MNFSYMEHILAFAGPGYRTTFSSGPKMYLNEPIIHIHHCNSYKTAGSGAVEY
jgi:hypothetical protein